MVCGSIPCSVHYQPLTGQGSDLPLDNEGDPYPIDGCLDSDTLGAYYWSESVLSTTPSLPAETCGESSILLPNAGKQAMVATSVTNQASGETLSNCSLPSDSTPTSCEPVTQARKHGNSSKIKARKGPLLSCPHTNCTHEGSFLRRYELDRHIRVKHGGKKPFSCPFPGCFQGTVPPSYARADKLTSHIRNVHAKHRDKALHCCFPDCTQAPLPIGILGVHIRQAHGWQTGTGRCHIADEGARAMCNAASTAHLQCPLWRCAKSSPLSLFMQHLEGHTSVELVEATDVLKSDGYHISHMTRSSPQLEPSDDYNAEEGGSSVHVQVRCPVCDDAFGTHEALWGHIDEEHLVAGDHQSHFRTWRQCAEDSHKFVRTHRFHPWQEWSLDVYKVWDTICPSCGYYQRRYHSCDHHTSMLVDSDEIRPYRGAILKLYPEFATHPVWKDLA